MRYVLVALLFTAVAEAKPVPPVVELDAEVIAIGKPPRSGCGYALATQRVSLQIRHVKRGSLKVGVRGELDVVMCTDGPLLVHVNDTYALDPGKLRPGSLIHFTAQDFGNNQFFGPHDQITVFKR